jgi:CBS domain-containing protein
MQARIADIAMMRLVSVTPNTNARTALGLLERSNLPLIPVMQGRRLVGTVSESALKKNIAEKKTVGDLMGKPLFVEQGKSIDYAIKYIMRHEISRVPVVESSIGMKCIGIVTASQLLKAKKSVKK